MCNKLTLIADEIIEYSDGAFRIEWSESYEELTLKEQRVVDEMVFDAIGDCSGCGWNFTWDSMETNSDGECFCWRCYQDLEEESEE